METGDPRSAQTNGTSNSTSNSTAKNASNESIDLKHFEGRLLEERKRAVAQMAEFDENLRQSQDAADGEDSNWRLHMADEGSDTFEQEQNFLLASREGSLIRLIDEGLRRLYSSPETYGRCDECGNAIGFERLDAIPYAVRCVNCKQSWEGGRAD